MRQILKVGLPVLVTCLLLGCIRPKQYRPVPVLTPLTVPATPDATARSSIAVDDKMALAVGPKCLSSSPGPKDTLTPAHDVINGVYTDSGPCIAFVEYNRAGTHYKRNGNQIESAVDLVNKAIRDDPQGQPVIIGFVHGWKHNANPGDAGLRRIRGDDNGSQVSKWPPEDDNIQGFEHVLNYLYRCSYANPNNQDKCLPKEREAARGTSVQGHVVVGIYFGWYGADISPFWPVAQTVSVYSRGFEADTVAKAHVFSEDLQTLSNAAHPPASNKNQPLFILVGHSFGARLLEEAITDPLKQRVQQQINDPSVPTFADLVLYINAAASAENAIGLEQFLGNYKVRYRKTGGDKSDVPLLASITTPADAATGIAFTIWMTPTSWVHGGKVQFHGFDPVTGKGFSFIEDQAKLYRDTFAHLQEFQTHSVNPVPGVPEKDCTGGPQETFYYWVPGHCFQVAPATPLPGQPFRWNGTPYWAMSTDQVIIPDHGTIFTNRFLRFVGHLLPNESDKPIVTGEIPKEH